VTSADLNEIVMWNNTGIYLSDSCSVVIQRTIVAYDYVDPIRCPAYGPAPQVDQCCFFLCGEDDTMCWDFISNLDEPPLFYDLEGRIARRRAR